MPKDMGDALGHVMREVVKNLGDATPKKKSSPLSGAKGVAAGAGLAALVPLAKKGADAVRSNGAEAASKAGDSAGSKLKDVASQKIDEAGGAGGLAKQAAGGLLGGGDSDGDGKGGMAGVGKGRRMPVQQAVDVAVPLETAYNQFTQFEDWPQFMHRVTRVTQEDDCTLSFATKIWGKTKEFQAKIVTQRPEERIKWKVSQGITHSGVVTFHELAPRLTRIEVNLDIEPGSLIEKAARGMRHVKRAVRADLARYKAFIEMQEMETGAWRGVIIGGEVVEEHDDSYDEERDYAEVSDAEDGEFDARSEHDEDDSDADDDKDEERGNGGSAQRTQRFRRQAEASRGRSSSRSRGGGSGNGSGSSSSRRKAASKS